MPESPELLSIDDLARITGRSGHWIRSEIHAGNLPAIRLGVRLLVRRDDFEKYLDHNAADGPDPRRNPQRNKRAVI